MSKSHVDLVLAKLDQLVEQSSASHPELSKSLNELRRELREAQEKLKQRERRAILLRIATAVKFARDFFTDDFLIPYEA